MKKKYKHKTWREKFKSLDQDSRDLRKEYLLAQALVYLLGSALVTQASPPSRDYGFLTPVFIFVNNGRYIIAFILLVIVMFLFWAAFIGKPKSVVPLALLSLQFGSFIPLVFFLTDLLLTVLELLNANANEVFILVFYLLGFLLLITTIIWNITRLPAVIRNYKKL
jgi:hypothetical protein